MAQLLPQGLLRGRSCALCSAVLGRGQQQVRSFAAAASQSNLFIWGKIEDSRMGMRVDTQGSTLTQVAMGPEIGPTRHPHLDNVAQVVCKAAKTLAITREGAVYSWGTCENNSLGHGTDTKVVHRPKRIEALDGIKIVAIAAGETSSAAVSEEGDVYTWGWGGSFWGGNGGLGHGDNTTQPHPALVQHLEEARIKVVSVAVGNGHMLAVTRDGKVLSWGNGEYGRCGNGKRRQLVPEHVELLQDKMCVAVAAGAQHSMALSSDGIVYAWGKNDSGQIGQGGNMVMDLNTMEEYPLEVSVESDNVVHFQDFHGHVTAIAAGGNQSLAVTRSGKVYQWGQRAFLHPSIVEFGYATPTGEKEASVALEAVSVAAGDGVSALIDRKGQLYTWGKNLSTGMLGHKEYSLGSRLPVRVEALVGEVVESASFGSRHAACVTR